MATQRMDRGHLALVVKCNGSWTCKKEAEAQPDGSGVQQVMLAKERPPGGEQGPLLCCNRRGPEEGGRMQRSQTSGEA